MNELSVDTRATISDLERRVRLLEEGLYGHSAPQCSTVVLMRCYIEAHRAIREIDQESGGIWVAQAYLWDVRALVSLGRHVNDPYPYRPFLAALDVCVLKGIPGADAAVRHLESVGQDLLYAEGLELVRPRDTMGTLRLHEALKRLATLRK
jgi:hypothetical protein